jgi:uncharacterized protein (DUF2235 family)
MALYAFDGTWNENEPSEAKDTNVVRFHDAYGGNKWYVEGPGTRLGFFGKLVGGVGGFGGKKRVKEAYAEVQRNFARGDNVIDVIGFSRGAALALDFANVVTKDGVNGQSAPPIRFMGLWDVVSSFGLPGNEIDLHYKFSLPANVAKCFHGMALDERRGNFKVHRIDLSGPKRDDCVSEVWFRGVHSDIGGGNGNVGLSSIALYWMLKRATACGLPIAPEALERAKQGINALAAISKNLDPLPDPLRVIAAADFVHQTVRFLKDCNNPKKGLKVVDDDGLVLAVGFDSV